MLNEEQNQYACRFFDRETRLCTIYDTRPLVCRLFDCDTERTERPNDRSHIPRLSITLLSSVIRFVPCLADSEEQMKLATILLLTTVSTTWTVIAWHPAPFLARLSLSAFALLTVVLVFMPFGGGRRDFGDNLVAAIGTIGFAGVGIYTIDSLHAPPLNAMVFNAALSCGAISIILGSRVAALWPNKSLGQHISDKPSVTKKWKRKATRRLSFDLDKMTLCGVPLFQPIEDVKNSGWGSADET